MGRKNHEERGRREAPASDPEAFPDFQTERLMAAQIARYPGVVGGTAEEAWRTQDPWFWVPADVSGGGIHERLGVAAPVAGFLNRDYQVAVYAAPGGGGWPDMWHLSIKRRDRAPIDTERWRILQRIKNTLVGPEHEAVELYPAETRLVDAANQYHLYCLASPGIRFPFGFSARLVTEHPGGQAVQRPFQEDGGAGKQP